MGDGLSSKTRMNKLSRLRRDCSEFVWRTLTMWMKGEEKDDGGEAVCALDVVGDGGGMRGIDG